MRHIDLIICDEAEPLTDTKLKELLDIDVIVKKGKGHIWRSWDKS